MPSMSSPLSCTPYSSSTICASSTRSRESTSMASNSASGLIWSGSAPNSSSALNTRCSICSLVMVVDIGFLLRRFLRSGGQAAVHGQTSSGHVAGLGRGQEADARRPLLGRAGPARGHGLQPLFLEALGHLGLDQA